MRKLTLTIFVVALLIVLLVATLFLQRSEIVLRLYSGFTEKTTAISKVSTLEDGLHVALCGAGGPMPSAHRSGPCVAVMAGGKLFLVDSGTNGVRNLTRMGFDPGSISAVFLTHFHSDHIDGLGEVATLRWAGGNHNSPLPVYGPQGVTTVVEGFNRAYSYDFVYRNDHHGDSVAPLGGKGLQALPFATPEPELSSIIYDELDLKIETFSVNHYPITPAVGYLFTYKGRTALISGDTTKIASVEKFAVNVDLLVHEALAAHLLKAMNEGASAAGNLPRAKIFLDVLNYHATPVEVAEIARDSKAGHLLYYHIVPPLDVPGAEATWLQGVDAVFQDYTLGRDGTHFFLPSGSNEIIQIQSAL